ncbi:hypothetical protein ACJMK2_014350 [Sinanodonta woodiana]|uniref:Sushi domain-containing protein n=1 Tax=Sinanodonta woodiana TaxID=1069815 RepID=A0ABD3V0E7_SINWO
MISRNFIIFGLYLIFLTAVTGAGLVNDTCHTVWIREDIIKRAAKLNCSDTARVYDPKSQNGSYLMDDTGNWGGVMFACLCSCKLPSDPKNVQNLSKDRIYHGETLNYSCNEGYEKSIERKIVCYDGLLMTVSGYLETQDIDIITRQKSLPDWFAHDYDGKVFDLWVNESANWSVPITELQKNQKVFQLFENETNLKYYMCRGNGCRLGCVSREMKGTDCISLGVRDLECKRNLSETTLPDKTTTIVPSSPDLSIIGYVVVGVAAVVIVCVAVVVVCLRCKRKEKEKSQNNPEKTEAEIPLSETSSPETVAS